MTPSFKLIEEQMPPSFRAGLEQRAERHRAVLEADFEVTHWGLLAEPEDARRANEQLLAADIEVAVVAAPMAAPPALAEVALAGLGAPTIIWNTAATAQLGAGLDQAAAHDDTALLGALMFANTEVRRGVAPIVVSADPGDAEQVGRLRRTIIAAGAAAALRHATVVRIGDPIEGYSDVQATAADLARLGVNERTVGVDELHEEFAAAGGRGAGEVAAHIAELGWAGESDAPSRQLAAALRRVVAKHEADCGTVNCHGPWFRSSADIGIVGCLGVSLCAAAGVPMSCTGDLPTALALKLGRDIAGSSLYCEIFAFETGSGLALLSNSGEGDPAVATDAPRLAPTHLYPGTRGTGTSVSFTVGTGPATLLSLTPTAHSWRLVAATGEIVDNRYPGFGAPNVMFRFDTDPDHVMERWLAAGPVHHHALAPGRIGEQLAVAARVLGVDYVAV